MGLEVEINASGKGRVVQGTEMWGVKGTKACLCLKGRIEGASVSII